MTGSFILILREWDIFSKCMCKAPNPAPCEEAEAPCQSCPPWQYPQMSLWSPFWQSSWNDRIWKEISVLGQGRKQVRAWGRLWKGNGGWGGCWGLRWDLLIRNFNGRLLISRPAPLVHPRCLPRHSHQQQNDHNCRGDEDEDGEKSHRGQHGAKTCRKNQERFVSSDWSQASSLSMPLLTLLITKGTNST